MPSSLRLFYSALVLFTLASANACSGPAGANGDAGANPDVNLGGDQEGQDPVDLVGIDDPFATGTAEGEPDDTGDSGPDSPIEPGPCGDADLDCGVDAPPRSGRRPSFCGEGEEGRLQLERTGGCDVFSAFTAPIPVCYPDQDTPLQWSTPPGGIVGVPIAPEDAPEVECELEAGCPEFLHGVQVPIRGLISEAWFGDAHVTSTGSLLVTDVIGGLFEFSLAGELVWSERSRLSTRVLIGVPGSDDVLLLQRDITPMWRAGNTTPEQWIDGEISYGDGTPPPGFCDRSESCYLNYISRRRPDHSYVWSFALQDFYLHLNVTLVDGWNAVQVETNPDDCSLTASPACSSYRTLLSLEDGSLIRCEALPFGSQSSEAGFGSASVVGRSYFLLDGDADNDGARDFRAGVQIRDFGRDISASFLLDDLNEGLAAPFTMARLADGTFIAATQSGIVHFTDDAEKLHEDDWFDEPVQRPGGPFGYPAVTHDGWIVWPTIVGLVRFRAEDIDTRNYTLQDGFGIATVVVAQDGSVLVSDQRHVVAFPDGQDGRHMWRIAQRARSANVTRVFLHGDVMILLDNAGGITWWRHVHGGLANTPLPRELFSLRRFPSGPFPAEPEQERRWTWREDGSGDGSGVP